MSDFMISTWVLNDDGTIAYNFILFMVGVFAFALSMLAIPTLVIENIWKTVSISTSSSLCIPLMKALSNAKVEEQPTDLRNQSDYEDQGRLIRDRFRREDVIWLSYWFCLGMMGFAYILKTWIYRQSSCSAMMDIVHSEACRKEMWKWAPPSSFIWFMVQLRAWRRGNAANIAADADETEKRKRMFIKLWLFWVSSK